MELYHPTPYQDGNIFLLGNVEILSNYGQALGRVRQQIIVGISLVKNELGSVDRECRHPAGTEQLLPPIVTRYLKPQWLTPNFRNIKNQMA
ncbi:hypothetical protein Hypma_002881 [Hypsizygus marmoreus]|uniref:Uncharacterized protein n=1 Tax=Hypsizygus marmoreus TaxID=39966 RepID=A0A369J9E3_HYPMA|nr:hypothetical protein Hypma_002881 [Hypsizygus marmoreus]